GAWEKSNRRAGFRRSLRRRFSAALRPFAAAGDIPARPLRAHARIAKVQSAMRVLLVGGGGREHALAWKLARSPLLTELVCAPGNAGTLEAGLNVAVKADDVPGLLRLARDRHADLGVVGP